MTPVVFETAARITAEATVFPAFAWNVQIGSQPILRGFRMLDAVKFSLRGIPHRVREFGTDLTHGEYQVFDWSMTAVWVAGFEARFPLSGDVFLSGKCFTSK